MILFYTKQQTQRLQYIVQVLLKTICGIDYQFTQNADEFNLYEGAKINYSTEGFSNAFQIIPHGLLYQTNIQLQTIRCFEYKNHKAFFNTGSTDFAFDIFSAAFYLVSRYEEYLPHQKDMYGRFAHENSLAFKENFLQLPLVNIWSAILKEELKKKFPFLIFKENNFTFIPTYDIDIAYSFKGKGWLRNVAGFLKSILSANFKQVTFRLNVLMNRATDPFDCYDWLNQLHKEHHLKPVYFFLLAKKLKGYDRNISIHNKIFQQQIINTAAYYSTGIHPSWQSNGSLQLLKDEIAFLQKLIQKPVTISRQHYIKFNLPQTYQRLMEAGIENDFSMGYGSINGFRASIATPFHWFDLEKNCETNLLLYPFCFMDANSFFELKHTPEQALQELMHYIKCIKTVNGCMITIWHNNFLGTEQQFAGWKSVYEKFIHSITVNLK